jgi:hypothetical protein
VPGGDEAPPASRHPDHAPMREVVAAALISWRLISFCSATPARDRSAIVLKTQAYCCTAKS